MLTAITTLIGALTVIVLLGLSCIGVALLITGAIAAMFGAGRDSEEHEEE